MEVEMQATDVETGVEPEEEGAEWGVDTGRDSMEVKEVEVKALARTASLGMSLCA